MVSRLLRKKTLQYREKWTGYDTDPKWYNAENFKGSICSGTSMQKILRLHDAPPNCPIGSTAGGNRRIETTITGSRRPEVRPRGTGTPHVLLIALGRSPVHVRSAGWNFGGFPSCISPRVLFVLYRLAE
jgi:hypothetical protein